MGAGKLIVLHAPPDTEAVLASIDDLRAKLVSGEIKAFVAVGIAPDHVTMLWQGATRPTTYLELMGAVARLQFRMNDED